MKLSYRDRDRDSIADTIETFLGMLAKEIDQGYWYVEEFDATQAFRDDTGKMWEELVERMGNGHPKPHDLRGA